MNVCLYNVVSHKIKSLHMNLFCGVHYIFEEINNKINNIFGKGFIFYHDFDEKQCLK